MTDMHSKRKWAGPPVSDLRKTAPDGRPLPSKAKPPHKKKRLYTLTVEWREEQVLRRSQTFATKQQREQAKIALTKELASKRSMWNWWRLYNEERTFHIKEGPTFIETQEVEE